MKEFIEPCINIAKQAGDAILQVYHQDDIQLCEKSDHTPVTKADLAANDVLLAQLHALSPNIPIMSEETPIPNLTERAHWQRYWLLDPLDGTGEFVLQSGDFAVNIALIENNKPVFGVIYWPTENVTYWAMQGVGAFKRENGEDQALKVKRSRNLRLAVSRRQNIDTVSQYINQAFDTLPLGSCSLKACAIAEGKADAFLRIGPTGEWDTGASQIIVEMAGGKLFDAEFNPITYNQRETTENPDFIVTGDQSYPWQEMIKPHRR
jgi:3'(2'), 5'-bisphosphate nucleotidase